MTSILINFGCKITFQIANWNERNSRWEFERKFREGRRNFGKTGGNVQGHGKSPNLAGQKLKVVVYLVSRAANTPRINIKIKETPFVMRKLANNNGKFSGYEGYCIGEHKLIFSFIFDTNVENESTAKDVMMLYKSVQKKVSLQRSSRYIVQMI